MRRTHEIKSSIVIPEPYVSCPFESDATDEKGHLTWTTNNVTSYSQTNGARFGGSNYLRCYNSFSLQKLMTMSYLVMFDSIPTDGNSSTWHTCHYIRGGNTDTYRYYSFLQHFTSENVELTNCAQSGSSFSIADNVLTTPFGSTQINTWYRITLRVNSTTNSVTAFIDSYKKDINAMIPTSETCDMRFGCNNNGQRYLRGYIKDLRIWDVELTDEQIAQL